MSARLRGLVVILLILTFLLSQALVDVHTVFSSESGRRIDLFTQKIPYNGKGLNQPCDAFQPQELVILYALVTYNDYPVANKLVTFVVNNPPNPFRNMTIVGVSPTNASGIAEFSFRVPWPDENPEQIIFGIWSVTATVDIAEQAVTDTLTFEVGWTIRITKITTLDENLSHKTRFLQLDKIAFNLTVRNIAWTLKTATITIDVQDVINYPIIHLQLDNLIFNPGENHLQASSEIPSTATVGTATISAVPFTAPPETDGVPYSPATLATFEIVTPPPKQYYLTVRNTPFNTIPIPGEGWYDEGTFAFLAAPTLVSAVETTRFKFLYWDVDGAAQGDGLYAISVLMDMNHTATAHYVIQYLVTFDQKGLDASASGIIIAVNDESKLLSDLPFGLWADNGTFIEYNYSRVVETSVWGKRFSLIDITAQASPILVLSKASIVGNYALQYHLSVLSPYGNPGGSGWYDDGSIAYASLDAGIFDHQNGTRRVFISWIGDASGADYGQSDPILMDSPKTAAASWKTQCHLIIKTDPVGVAIIPGEDWYDQYSSVALAAPPAEGYDFRFWDVDGVLFDEGISAIVVQMDGPHIATAHYSKQGWPWPFPEWMFWLLLVLLVLLVVLPLILLYLRKRRREEEAFYSGWTAWYYGYSMEEKNGRRQRKPRRTSRKKQ